MRRSKGGLTTKIHAFVDAADRPIELILTPGQADDGRSAAETLDHLPRGAVLLADRAYDSSTIRAQAARQDVWANIPNEAPTRELPLLSKSLQTTQSDQALLQQTQAIQECRDQI